MAEVNLGCTGEDLRGSRKDRGVKLVTGKISESDREPFSRQFTRRGSGSAELVKTRIVVDIYGTSVKWRPALHRVGRKYEGGQ